MKKHYICILLTAVVMFSGCSSLSKMLYPNTQTAELYYNTVQIKKDAMAQKKYDDLFLKDFVAAGVPQNAISGQEKRTLTADTLNYLDYAPTAQPEKGDILSNWISNTVCQYGFTGATPLDNKVVYYMLKSFNTNSTYNDYLYIMRVLSIKFGECTTEIYKKGSSAINSAELKKDMETNEIIEFYNSAFAKGEISITSRWVLKNYSITVNFSSPENCSVAYEFTYLQ